MHNTTDEQTVEQQELAEKLQVFGDRLSKMAQEAVSKRAQIETRWLADYRQFHGEYDEETKAKLKSGSGSEVFVNITRNKKSAAEARAQDMLFPTDDRNWGIKPTPVPELSGAEDGDSLEINGQQVDKTELAKQVEKVARDKSGAMEKTIDDQLNEARYNPKARDVISDACLLGTGILKGPVVIGRMRKIWETLPDGVSTLKMVEDLVPTVERVDPWDFFPDMSASTIDEAEFIFERHRLTKKQLREFAKMPGVILDQVRNVLEGEAADTQYSKDHTSDIRSITGVDSVSSSNRYEMWEYHGPIDKKDLLSAGVELDEDEADNPLSEFEGVVFFIGTHVVKVVINPLDTEERPYSVFNWESDTSSIFGFGVPYLMRNPQKVICAAWRMMLDNGGMSVADQVIVNKQIVSPADGNWALTPKKLWYLKDKTKTVAEAFATFSTQSHQSELANIFTMARQLADEETNLPLIAQGEQSAHVTKTSSGMAMLMNSANIVLRRAVKNWDDDITDSLIARFYDWNMQYSEDPSIKGDFKIDARGSSALLVREKQQENLMVLANISANNPHLAARRDWAGLDAEMMKALEVPVDKVTLSEDEIKENQKSMAESEPQDPALIKAQLDAQIAKGKMQLEQQKLRQEGQIKLQELDLKRELGYADIAAKENITITQLQANIGLEEQKEKTKRDIAAVNANLGQTDLQLKAENQAAGYDSHG